VSICSVIEETRKDGKGGADRAKIGAQCGELTHESLLGFSNGWR